MASYIEVGVNVKVVMSNEKINKFINLLYKKTLKKDEIGTICQLYALVVDEQEFKVVLDEALYMWEDRYGKEEIEQVVAQTFANFVIDIKKQNRKDNKFEYFTLLDYDDDKVKDFFEELYLKIRGVFMMKNDTYKKTNN